MERFNRKTPCCTCGCGCERCDLPDCRCNTQSRPCPGMFLLDKVVCRGRTQSNCQRINLCLLGLPECTRFPVRICSVSYRGEPIETCGVDGKCALGIKAIIPLFVSVIDACGQSYQASTKIETVIQLRCQDREPSFTNIVVVPCIELLRAEQSCTNSFEAELRICIDAYAVKPEACSWNQWCNEKTPCNTLPMYPQLCCDKTHFM